MMQACPDHSAESGIAIGVAEAGGNIRLADTGAFANSGDLRIRFRRPQSIAARIASTVRG